MVPSWQFSMDPAFNPKINPHVKYPEGWSQMTIQPQGPYMTRPTASGMGSIFEYSPGSIPPKTSNMRFGARGCCDGGTAPDDCCNAGRARSYIAPTRSLMGPGLGSMFDSWAWNNRKWIVLGGIGLLGAAALLGAGALLK